MANTETKKVPMRQSTFTVGFKTPVLYSVDGENLKVIGSIEGINGKPATKAQLKEFCTNNDIPEENTMFGAAVRIEEKYQVSEQSLYEFMKTNGKLI